jgi:hypothetical protein
MVEDRSLRVQIGSSLASGKGENYSRSGDKVICPDRFRFALPAFVVRLVWVQAGATMKQGNAPAVRKLRHHKTRFRSLQIIIVAGKGIYEGEWD